MSLLEIYQTLHAQKRMVDVPTNVMNKIINRSLLCFVKHKPVNKLTLSGILKLKISIKDFYGLYISIREMGISVIGRQ